MIVLESIEFRRNPTSVFRSTQKASCALAASLVGSFFALREPMTSSLLHIWIGTGNLGNAAPDEASWKEWVPADGYFCSEKDANGDPRYRCVTTLPTNEDDSYDNLQQFDILVFGMQESTFDPPSKETGGKHGSANTSETIPELPVVDTTDHGEDVEEEEEHSSSNLGGLKNVTSLLSPTAKVVGHTVHTIGKTTTKTVRKIHSKTGQTIQSIQTLSTSRDHCQSPQQGAFSKKGSVLSKLTRSTDTGETWLGGTSVLHALLNERCPSYQRIISFQRGEMRLAILVHRACPVEILSVAAQNTGRAGLANKGGIVAELRVSGTRLSFGTAHLEAHEGMVKYQTRVATLADIFSGTTPPPGHDVSLTAHYSFFMGDLNFRTEVPNHKELTEEEHKQIVRDMVKRQDWPALNSIDELQRALKNRECLVGYQTLPCHFPPTFKVERKKGYEYIDKRRPSYTDRILWKANHGLRELQPLLYEPIADFTSSDHKPVRAAFSVPRNEPYALRPKLSKHRSLPRLSLLIHKRKHDMSSSMQLGHKERFHLFVSEISCQIFVKNKSSRALVQTVPHPYICIMSDPPEALQSKVERGIRLRYSNLVRAFTLKSRRRSRMLNTTCFLDSQGFPRSSILRPNKWSTPCCGTHCWNEEVHTEIKTHHPDGSSLDLTGAMLRITVMDHLFRTSATGERNVVLGTVVVNLVNLLRACWRPPLSSRAFDRTETCASGAEDPIATVQIDEPLLKNGVETGHLKCQLEVWWMDDRTAKVFAGLGVATSGRQRRRNNRLHLQNSANSTSSDLRQRWSEQKTQTSEVKPKRRLQRA
jgi:hypothetical protein